MKNNPQVTGRSKGSDRYYALFAWFTNTDAWRSLNAVERCVYLQLAQRYRGTNNGRIVFGVRDGEKELRVGRATILRALHTLEQRGFVAVTRKGHFARKEGSRAATEWRLTQFGCDVTGALATKDFARWQSAEIISPAHFRTGTGAVVERSGST